MNIVGYIQNENTGNPTKGKVTVIENGNTILVVDVDNEGVFFINNLFQDAGTSLKIEAPGCETKLFGSLELDEGANYFLLKTATSILPVVGIAAAALYFANRKKKVGTITAGDLVPIAAVGVGILGFSLVKQLLEKLGIWDSKDTKDLDNSTTDPLSFWNPNFWRNKPANVPFTSPITTSTATAYANEIYNAFGALNDCEECAINVFRRCRTKANASYVCDIFSQKYGLDLLMFLRGGIWPQDRLSDADVNTINNYVKNLPDY